MGLLFDRDRTVISRHVANLYREGELEREGTCAKFAQVQMEDNREVVRQDVFTDDMHCTSSVNSAAAWAQVPMVRPRKRRAAFDDALKARPHMP